MDAYLQFVRAAEAKDANAITRLIREHPGLHNFEGDDGTLIDVIRHNCPQLFEAAFAAGLSPDSGPPEQHETLLQHAVCESDIELVRLALNHGAEIERRNVDGETALGYAASWGSLDTVRTLVEAGADVNAVEGNEANHYSTALDVAGKRPEIFLYLQEHGAKKFSELSPSD